MMASVGRNVPTLFKLIEHEIVMFDYIHILFHFNIILKHNWMSSTKT